MQPIAGSTRALSAPGGSGVAAQIGFSPRGHFLTVTLRSTQTLDTFRLGGDDRPGPARPNPATDQNPFGFAYRSDGLAVVSNAGEAGDPA